VAKNILLSRFWQAFFAPKEHPKIARSFNCGSTPPKKQSPAGATEKTVAENSAAPPGLADFYRLKPAVETAGHSHPSPRDFAPWRLCVKTICENSRNSRQKIHVLSRPRLTPFDSSLFSIPCFN
jgi:hypothetical protein